MTLSLDDKDRQLLNLLSADSRTPVTELARKLKLSRSTVNDRIARLQQRGVIQGFTLRYSESFTDSQLHAHVMINSDPKRAAQIVRALQKIPAVTSLHAVNGVYDMIAMVQCASPKALDATLDSIGGLDGIEKTVSSIILSTKFDRAAGSSL